MDTNGLGMMMGAIRKLIPDHVWQLVETNIIGMGKVVADIQASQKRMEEKQDRILSLLEPTKHESIKTFVAALDAPKPEAINGTGT